MYRLSLVVVALLLASCGGPATPTIAPTTAATGVLTATPEVSAEPTPRPTPSTLLLLTSGEAQAAFQQIAEDVDLAMNEAHGGFEDGRSLKALTAASCADLVAAMDAAKYAFTTTAWPVEVERLVPAVIAGLDKARDAAADPATCPERGFMFTFLLFRGLQEPGDAFRRALGLPPRNPKFYL